MNINRFIRLQRTYSFFTIIFTHCVVFAFVAWLFLPNMDIDMFENYAWGQTFEWGSFKHPPFFAWITRLWFTIWPTTHFSYYCLSYFNLGIGLWGILALARLLFIDSYGKIAKPHQLRQFLLLVLGFSLLGLPYNLYAAVFNADSILLSLWPWTAYAFMASIQSETKKGRWLWTLMLGILAASSFLSKYYSAVFLLTLFIISIAEYQYRTWYLTPYPYVSLLLFVTLIYPHVLWEYRIHFPFTTYYSNYLVSNEKMIFKHAIMLVMTVVYFFAGSWVAWILIKISQNKSQGTSGKKVIGNRIFYSFCQIPILLTVIVSLSAGIMVMDRWTIPVWFSLPIFMANQLTTHLDDLGSYLKVLRYCWIAMVGLIGIVLGITLGCSNSYLGRHHDYNEARKEMVMNVASRFHALFPQKELEWVGGMIWPDHTAPFSYYLKNHPRAVPGFPDQMPALVNPYQLWNQQYGVIVCGNKPYNQGQLSECENQTRLWLESRGLPRREETVTYYAKGWRWHFLKAPQRQVKVFWIIPVLHH